MWDEVVSAESLGDLAARLAWYRIDTMPSFAAFFWGPDGMRSLVRGGVSVVDADTGDVLVTGEGVQTWVETGLGGVRQVRVDLPAATRPDDAFPLPLVVGVVGVSTVFLDASDEATALPDPGERPTEAEPEPQPEPEPFPEDVGAVGEEPTSRVVHENAETRWVPIPELDDAPVDAVVLADPAAAGGPTVEAVFCAWGHPNPAGAERCRVCTGPIAQQRPRAIVAPVLAVLKASNGESADVVGSVLVGRAPARDRARVPDPDLLTVNSPSHDISRTHLEVFASGWEVAVTDLHSTNGTVLVAPDGSMRTMASGETSTVALGSSLELADGISVLIDFPQ